MILENDVFASLFDVIGHREALAADYKAAKETALRLLGRNLVNQALAWPIFETTLWLDLTPSAEHKAHHRTKPIYTPPKPVLWPVPYRQWPTIIQPDLNDLHLWPQPAAVLLAPVEPMNALDN